uniref:Guanine nucleotide-binding protein subunit beta-like protein (Cytoplasmic antigenic protein 1) n=1 Tax=Ganoderma boninense TaxID=34458 RepID=A0A5K1K397_9APHY|nr:Guanine nucleotide-binding protein subunit beta-like protein (Cytoplasmic antigenic protein 1) [Ganoderma boninense]
MARGVASPAPNALPKVSFVKITDDPTQQAAGVADQVARSYGYNGPSVFQQEKHYIRYIEPLESDLAVQVEYDMDEQDQEWVDALNGERKAQQLDKVSYETFEIVMDRLEKEWFDLTKNIPKSDIALPSEDSTCAICDDSEGENANAIVFCDGCNLAVHQDCYGVPYIPEGSGSSCILCPKEGGAFKQTVSGDWVHLLCAIWVPETAVANEVFMEPITGVEKISKQRWKLRCSVCDEKHGACIQCTKSSCFTAFHATCARKEKFLMPMKASQGSEAPVLACYCEKHLPPEQLRVREAAIEADSDEGDEMEGHHQTPKSSKSARAYNKTYKPGPPLVPRIIVNRILHYISRIQVRHKQDFVHLVCRYWSLKREARRGAPLLKRLHLEPWTALSGSKQQTDQEKAVKLDLMKGLRDDLERMRTIAEVVRLRERVKQAQSEAVQDVLLHFLFPHEGPLRLAFQRITAHDRQNGYFKTPVNKMEVPDYYDVIKDPMCWDMIDQKLDRHEYLDLAEFKRDINLVLDNATTYNEPSTPYYKTAVRIRNAAQALLAELDGLVHHHPPAPVPNAEPPADGGKVEEVDCQPEQLGTDISMPPIGDLEPPLEVLDLLMSEEAVRNDTNLVLTSTPIESLLQFELPLIRPPAPPPPPVKEFVSNPVLHERMRRKREKEREMEMEREKEREMEREKEREKGKRPKYDRSAAIKRKREERHAALDASPGFRSTRTRAGAAAAAAFEAEVVSTPETPDESAVAGDQPMAEAGPSATPTRPRRQRKSTALPTSDMPPTVDDVDNWQSFKMFEVGWILPPEQKRRGRIGTERGPVPPPRKRAKTSKITFDELYNVTLIDLFPCPEHDKSRLSEVSAAATDEQAVHPLTKEGSQEPEPSEASIPASSEPREAAQFETPEPALPDASPSEPLPSEPPSFEVPDVVMAEPSASAPPERSASPSPPEVDPGLAQQASSPPASPPPASPPPASPPPVSLPPPSPAPSEPTLLDARHVPQPSPPPSSFRQSEADHSPAPEHNDLPEPPTAGVPGASFDDVDEDIEIDVVTVSSPALPPSVPELGVPELPEESMSPGSPGRKPEPETVPEVKSQTAPELESVPEPEPVPEHVLDSVPVTSPSSPHNVVEEATQDESRKSPEMPEEIPEVLEESPEVVKENPEVPEESPEVPKDIFEALEEAMDVDTREEPPSRPAKRKAPEPDPDETEDEFIDASHPPKPPTPSPPPEPRRKQEPPHAETPSVGEPERMEIDVDGPAPVEIPEPELKPEPEHIEVDEPEHLDVGGPEHIHVDEPERIELDEEEQHEETQAAPVEAASPRFPTPERAASIRPSPAPMRPASMPPAAEPRAPSSVAEAPAAPSPMAEPSAPSPAPPAQPEPSPGEGREQEHGPEAHPKFAAPQEEVQEEMPPADTAAAAAAEETQPEPQPEEEEEDTRPVKIIWIDVIDTPAIRREKAKQKRLEREARKRAEEAAAAAALAPEASGSGSSVAEAAAAMDVDSDLTDLDEDVTEDDENVPAPPAPPARVDAPEEDGAAGAGHDRLGGGREARRRDASVGEVRLASFSPSFPFWPAVVFEEDSPEVPKNVLLTAPANRGNAVALVRFYEKKTARRSNAWAWVKVANMRYLGEDSALDAAMLAPTSKYQKWRTAYKRTECRNAFQDALAEMEGEDEALANALGEPASRGQPRSAAKPQLQAADAPGGDPPHLVGEQSPTAVEVAMGSADSPMTEVE